MNMQLKRFRPDCNHVSCNDKKQKLGCLTFFCKKCCHFICLDSSQGVFGWLQNLDAFSIYDLLQQSFENTRGRDTPSGFYGLFVRAKMFKFVELQQGYLLILVWNRNFFGRDEFFKSFSQKCIWLNFNSEQKKVFQAQENGNSSPGHSRAIFSNLVQQWQEEQNFSCS